MELGRIVTAIGIAITLVGLWITFGPSVPGLGWLGNLPGDLHFERGGMRVWLPITSCIVVSLVLTLLSHLFLRR
jgi:hypothetical protein